jgi:hypothetical protein
MGYQIPEQPLLVYPSLARQYGLEEALLLGLYHQCAARIGLREARGYLELKLDNRSWQGLVTFWDQDRLAAITSSLVTQGALEASFSATGIRIVLLAEESASTAPAVNAAPAASHHETVSRLTVRDQPPPRPVSAPVRPQPAAVAARTPAPSFGGSTGWRRHKSELQVLFEQHEERNQKLHSIYLGWQPSATFFELLARQGIPDAFAREYIDEFVLYWLDKDHRETNWDQKFLAWVKREWVKKANRDGREQRQAQQQTGFNHENTRRDTRENRKRVTQAIMDIKDTDW